MLVEGQKPQVRASSRAAPPKRRFNKLFGIRHNVIWSLQVLSEDRADIKKKVKGLTVKYAAYHVAIFKMQPVTS